jgi:hypothetical protein
MLINETLQLATIDFLNQTGGNVGTATTTVDLASHIRITQTTGTALAPITIGLFAPTNPVVGQVLYLSSHSSSTGYFAIAGVTVNPGTHITLIYGTTWQLESYVPTPTATQITKVSTTLAISAMTINTVPLYTVPAGKTFNLTNIVLKVSSATGTTTVTPAISVGTNGGTYNNILSNTTLIGTTATGRLWNQPIIGSSIDIQSGIGIFLRVNTAQAGATALTYTAELFGNLI